MNLVHIPFSAVRAALDRREAEWNQETTDSYNTSHHSHADITRVLPDVDHHVPDLHTEHLDNWLPVIASSQHVRSYHIVELSRRCVSALVSARAGWAFNERIIPSVMEDLMECFPLITSTTITAGHTSSSPPVNHNIAELLANDDFFVRLDGCSPKDGQGPSRPRTLKHVITKLVTSVRAWRALEETLQGRNEQKARLYLLPFRPHMNPDREYRVFCPPKTGVHRIAAISQYRWGQPWKGGNVGEQSEQTSQRVLEGTKQLHRNIVRHSETLREDGKAWVMENFVKDGFTFDVFDTGEEIQLVEVNPFGAMSGCGSCLFHWIRDGEVLYGKRGEVEFRVAIDQQERQ